MTDSAIILACSSLKDYVEEAQRKLNTEIPAVYLSRKYHRDPQEMKEHIIDALSEMPEEIGTVLVVMGYCGGSWEGVSCDKRLVIPKVDDCVSLLLQLNDEPVSDLKKPGHFYVREKDPSKESIKGIFERMAADLDEETRARYLKDWQDIFSGISIMDTGINGCRRQEYYAAVKVDADWLEAELDYVSAGTHLIEKLLKGNWDRQFLVLEPGEKANSKDILIDRGQDGKD